MAANRSNKPGCGLADLRLSNVPAVIDELTAVRHTVARWASAAELSDDQVQDVALAVHEALTNVVEHAYHVRGGEFDLHAAQDRDNVTITVTDHGQWQPPANSAETLRGRGLMLIKALATEFELRRRPVGTVVWMRWARLAIGPRLS